MPSSEAGTLDAESRRLLVEVAWDSIRHGLAVGRPSHPNPSDYPEPLHAWGAAFVTLHHLGALRGCVGHLEAIQPLVLDVADNAFAAAFRDTRFAPLEAWELDGLTLDVSVLTAPEPLSFQDEEDLIRQLRPGEDGLILEDGWARGTFLPAVWESLPNPRELLNELKAKAGLPRGHWSNRLRLARYRTETFSG